MEPCEDEFYDTEADHDDAYYILIDAQSSSRQAPISASLYKANLNENDELIKGIVEVPYCERKTLANRLYENVELQEKGITRIIFTQRVRSRLSQKPFKNYFQIVEGSVLRECAICGGCMAQINEDLYKCRVCKSEEDIGGLVLDFSDSGR